MASSLFVNTLQVEFTSVLTMEHAGMVRMFKTLEDTGLRGFLEGTNPIFESVIVEFFSYARVIAGTIVSTVFGQNLVVTEEIFSGMFKLPIEGMQNFSGIPNETIAEMRTRFSATTVPFQSSESKKTVSRIHGSNQYIDGTTGSADLGTTTKLHDKKVLTSKQVENYIKTNQGTTPTEETASNTEGGTSQQVPPRVSKSLVDATEQNMPNPKKRKHKGGATKTQTKQAATQITTTPPDTTATKIVENRETVVSTNFDPEEDSKTDSCPLVQLRCKKKQVSESPHQQVSESSDSLHLTHLWKRMRTQRQHKPSGWTNTTKPDPISALTTAPEEFPDEQILQGGGVDNFADNLDLYDQTEQDEPNNQNVNVDSPHQIVPTEGEGTNADDEQRDHGSQDPTTLDINLSEQGKGEVNLDDGLNNDARTEHERQPEPDYIADASESPLHDSIPIIPENHEGNVAYQRTANSPQKADDVVQYKLHRKVLRLIAAAHRHHRGLVGLPFTTPECDFLPKFSPALEIYNLTGTTQGSVLDTYSQHEHHVNQTATHDSYEHKAQENEPLIQKADHEHQGQDRQGSVEGVDPRLNAIPISAINTEAIPRTEQDVSPHQDPDFSNLQLIATAPQESSTLQLLHTATQSLNAISTHVSSLDQSYARLRDDTNITRHHTTNLRDELKSTTEGFDIRIDVLERTLTQRMVDELAVVKSQLAVIVDDLKESGAAKKGEGGLSSRPREGPSGRGLTGGRGGSSSQGGRGRGRSDDPERFKYSKWF
ncbi:hypothetical protein F511_03536 [Dorcoceras hygrometricum]|uniref:Uncharacterized protein n=1 Tax=Dorcoceras hygrometricum TaxID=472368 RepID=A0A2Z7AA89_9LAMI|nr:hypothetical protein F511_03536 [Dorcoceras hygrometricum]